MGHPRDLPPFPTRPSSDLTPAGAAQAVRQFLALAPRPTALYCFNNTLAGLIIEGLRQDGRRVPEEVSVVGGGGEEGPGLRSEERSVGKGCRSRRSALH